MTPELFVSFMVGVLVMWGTGFILAFLALRRVSISGTGEVATRQIVQVIVVPNLVGITALVVTVVLLGR